MKSYQLQDPQKVVIGLCVIVLLAIISFWLWGASPWRPPAAVKLDGEALAPLAIQTPKLNTAAVGEMIERPLFIANRRPVEKEAKKTAEEATAVDFFNDIRLVGIIGRGADGVAILFMENKNRRVRQGDELNGWTLREINGKTVRFSRGAEKRELVMKLAVPVAGLSGATMPTVEKQVTANNVSQERSAEEIAAERRARRDEVLRARGIMK